MVGLFNKKKKKMSWQIPTQVEQDIIAGKATYRTFQTGNGGQSILPVPANAYVVIFGYDFSPAGGGFKKYSLQTPSVGIVLNDSGIRWFETQQIAFYTGTDFYPFIHHVDIRTSITPNAIDASVPDAQAVINYQVVEEIDNAPIARQVYITSSNDITITHGIIQNAIRVSLNPIPVTNRTPQGLTYGGSGIICQTQTNYGPGGNPLQFMQPSPKDYQDFGFGLLPANADGQAFATPNIGNGVREANDWLANGLGIANAAACDYYLCLHYALYQKPIPSNQG